MFTDYIVKHRWTGTEESGSKNCPMVSFDDDVSVLGNAIIHESFESSERKPSQWEQLNE